MNDYPLSSETIQLSTYSRATEAQFSVTDSRSGKRYFKEEARNPPTERVITFRLTQQQSAIFQAWFRGKLSHGFLPFDVELMTEWGKQKITCRFLPDGLLNATRTEYFWIYSAKVIIERYEPPAFVPPDLADFPEYITDTAWDWLDIIVNTQLNRA